MTIENHKKDRIAKVIARAGICSRSQAETLIGQGKVKVNGRVLESPALNVGPDDEILIQDKPLPSADQTRLFSYHKKPGLVTSNKDEKGRPTIFDHLPDDLPRVMTVGRLDINTEGLLLLTNDGELARYLELPSTGWTRQYRVRVFGKVDPERLNALKKGITLEGQRYRPIQARIETEGTNSWLHVALKEGKNREIRKVMHALGLEVNRLIRTDYGPFGLGKLPPGQVKEIPHKILKEQIKGFFTK